MSEIEGVIKFTMDHEPSDPPACDEILNELMMWRDLCRKLNFLGQDPNRYMGYGYGNISARHSGLQFLISASQTSGVETSQPKHFALVSDACLAENRLTSTGAMPPSSESMTHSAIYQMSDRVHWVVHAHNPEIWTHSDRLDMPFTAADIPYGTPEMADAVMTLCQSFERPEQGIFVMKGHQDGVVSYAPTGKQAVQLMIEAYLSALTV